MGYTECDYVSASALDADYVAESPAVGTDVAGG